MAGLDDRGFHIIDSYELNDGRAAQELFPSYSQVVWDEVFFDSFQAGFLKGSTTPSASA